MANTLNHKLENLRLKQNALQNIWEQTGNKDLLDIFVKILPKALDIEVCSIFIHDPVTDKLWLKAATNLEEREIEVPREGSFVGEVIATGECKIEMNIDQRPGVHKKVDSKTGFVTRNMMCIPIKNILGDGVNGVITVLNKAGSKQYSQEDQQILEQIAHQLELMIQQIFIGQEMTDWTSSASRKMSVDQSLSNIWVSIAAVIVVSFFGLLMYQSFLTPIKSLLP